MKTILIGSRALQYWDPTLKLRDSSDWDVISDTLIPGTEWHDPDLLNNREMETLTSPKTVEYEGNTLYIMSMKGLAIIKRSHLWRDYKFQSHITQYHRHKLADHFQLMVEHNDKALSLYDERLELTHKAFPNKHPKLNKGKDDFFSDAVTRKYDHDSIHELVAHYPRPLYTELLVSQDQVLCSKDKWRVMRRKKKLLCTSEEVMVIAIERFLVPNHDHSYLHAYLKSLNKVCTTMCSGWFRDFAIDNYPAIMNTYDKNKLTKALKSLGELDGH
jgi:hypothetical protein